jgi:hypothetical protein
MATVPQRADGRPDSAGYLVGLTAAGVTTSPVIGKAGLSRRPGPGSRLFTGL